MMKAVTSIKESIPLDQQSAIVNSFKFPCLFNSKGIDFVAAQWEGKQKIANFFKEWHWIDFSWRDIWKSFVEPFKHSVDSFLDRNFHHNPFN